MIQTYNDILQEIQQFKHKLSQSVQIQKIYSSSRYISLQLRLPGQNLFFNIGRGHSFEGIWISQKNIPVILRKKDKFLEYLRKYLVSAYLENVDIDEMDRVILLTYKKNGNYQKLYIFYSGRDMYFLNTYKENETDLIFCSWKGKVYKTDDSLITLFDEVGRKEISDKQTQSKVVDFALLLQDEEKKISLESPSNKRQKFIKRKIKNIQDDLQMEEDLLVLENILKTENLELLPSKLKLKKNSIKFTTNDHYKRRNEIFQKIKKIKIGIAIARERLESTQNDLRDVVNEKINTLKAIEPIWGLRKDKVKINETHDQYKVYKYENYQIAVGLTAIGNDQVRNQFASKEDIWFHLDGMPSPHLIVKLIHGNLDTNIFKSVNVIMKKYSKVESSILPVVFTQVKNLKGIKGQPGKVTFKKEKRMQLNELL